MKKIIALFLALILVFSLTACGEPETIATMADIYKAGYRTDQSYIIESYYAAVVNKDGKDEHVVICEISSYQKSQIENVYEEGGDTEKKIVNVIAQNAFMQFVPADVIAATVLNFNGFTKEFFEDYILLSTGGRGSAPVKEYASLEEMTDNTGINIIKIGVAGVGNESFNVLEDGTSVYSFRLAGNTYEVRATKDLSIDVSGLSAYNEPIIDSNGVVSLKSFENDDAKSMGFIYDGIQYAFIVYDKGSLSFDDFDDMQEEYRELVYSQSFDQRLLEFEGTEDAENDSNIMMMGLPLDPNTIQISIYQYGKDGGTKAYAMPCYYKNGKLVYDQMVMTEFVDYQLKSTISEGGYFDIKGDSLVWTSAPTEELAKAIFD